MRPILWLHAIHGRNADIFHLLEENRIEKPKDSFERCLQEAIKCHHNDFANYIQENLMNNSENIVDYCFRYYNFGLWPEEMSNHFIFFYLCKYNYFNLVKLFVNEMNIDLNSEIEINVILYKLS